MSEAARTDLAHVQETSVIRADAGSIMEVISRAAADPGTDVEKLTKLVDLYDRISARTAEQQYSEAMNAAQEQMRPVATDANNPSTKSKYASYGALDKALRPIYTRNGFSVSFDTADGAPPDYVRVVCKVAHSAGHKEFPHLDMPADGKGAKGGDVMTRTHAIGAAVTYGKRYLLGMIFNIAVGDVEQDGNSNGGREMGEAAKRAVEEINACADAGALVLWKKNTAPGVMNVVTDAEGREIISLFNRRVASMKDASHG
jgi:hypothetical protein